MAQENRQLGGMVTVLTGEETIVTIGPGTWDLIDIGIDSDGAAQTSAKVLIGLAGRIVAADFVPDDGKFYLRQSTATMEHCQRVKGPAEVRVIALTAETTLLIRPAY